MIDNIFSVIIKMLDYSTTALGFIIITFGIILLILVVKTELSKRNIF